MIKYIDKSNLHLLEEYKKNDVFSLRVFSLLDSYSTDYDFARFWVQIIDEKVTAVLSKFDNDITLSFLPDADDEEIAEFVFAVGFSSLQCDSSFSLDAEFSVGNVLCLKIGDEVNDSSADTYEYLKNTDINDVYKLNFGEIKNNDAYMSWYADILHRIRHKTAESCVLKLDGQSVSCAVLSAIHADSALISYVATKKEYRKRGLASSLINHICSNKRNYYILTDCDENRRFYEKLGFVTIGRWKVYKL